MPSFSYKDLDVMQSKPMNLESDFPMFFVSGEQLIDLLWNKDWQDWQNWLDMQNAFMDFNTLYNLTWTLASKLKEDIHTRV